MADHALTRRAFVGAAALLPALSFPGFALAQQASPLAGAAEEAWLYGLALIENAAARDQVRRGGTAPNTMLHARDLTTPANQFVTTPNNDTLYSRAWLDLSRGPVRVTLPRTGNRYISVALMDMYTNNFAVLGTRTTGGDGGSFIVVGPTDATDDPRAIRSPTRWVWLLSRVLVDGSSDLAAARAVQDGVRVEGPATAWTIRPPVPRTADAMTYFAAMQALLAENPPPATDDAFFARVRPLGLGARGGFDPRRFDAAQRAEIEAGIAAARQRLRSLRRQGPVADGWSYPKSNLGDYGQDYFYRGQVALGGLAALPNAEAMYMRPVNAEGGNPFDSAQNWVLRLPANRLPPVDGFWSVTMYRMTPDGQYFFFDNPVDRYAIGDRTEGLKRGPDGGIEIWMSRTDPGADKRSNWLPTPPEGPFGIVLRTYLPQAALIDGTYRLPPLERFSG